MQQNFLHSDDIDIESLDLTSNGGVSFRPWTRVRCSDVIANVVGHQIQTRLRLKLENPTKEIGKAAYLKLHLYD